MKRLMLLVFALFLATNIFAYTGSICVADYYSNIERPFVIDCYGVIDSIEIYETYFWNMINGWYTLPIN